MKCLSNLKYSEENIDKSLIEKKVRDILVKSGIQDEYIDDGNLLVNKAVEHLGYDVLLSRFLESRFLIEDHVPNKHSVPKRIISEDSVDIWEHDFKFKNHFVESKENVILEDTQHAKSCGGCRETGKNTCYTCSGSGSNTCSTCSGRGENKCSNCYGNGETRCIWCSGSGRITEGSGDSQKVRNCRQCHGRGVNPCNSCRNGYVGCTTCSTQGKVTCSICSGDGDVTCGTCDGYKTLNHFYRLHVIFNNQSSWFSATEFEENHSVDKLKDVNLKIRSKIDEIIKSEISVGDLKSIESTKIKNKVDEFFVWEMTKEDKFRNLQDKIELFNKTILEVEFVLHGRAYTLYLNKKQDKYFFNSSLPSDFYEVDLISVAYNRLKEDDFVGAIKIIQEISKFEGTQIGESELISFIQNTIELKNAYDDYSSKKIIGSEKTIKKIKEEYKKELPYLFLRKHLNAVYNKASLLSFAYITLPLSILLHFALDSVVLPQLLSVTLGSILVAIILNYAFRRKLAAGIIVQILFLVGITLVFSNFSHNPKSILSDRALTIELNRLMKVSDLAVVDGDTLIITGYTGNEQLGENYYLPKGARFRIYNEYKLVDGRMIGQGYYKTKYARDRTELAINGEKRSSDGWQTFIDLNKGLMLVVERSNIDVVMDEIPSKEIVGIKANIHDLKRNSVKQWYVGANKIIYKNDQ
tara:strand:- start:2307 stop:4388 length:2082 start_codon:yes stop_codon:yes gene_type:complete